MLRALYTLLMHVAMPLILLRLWLRGRVESGYRMHIGERFGGMDDGGGAAADALPSIWIHAVSVGEVRAAVPLVGALRAAYPQARVVLTCMTPTGRRTAHDLFNRGVSVCYLPYDLPWALARFMRRWQPMMLVIMETELWPNLLAACASRRIPSFLANARLSEKSRRGYAKYSLIRALAGEAFARFTAVMAQSTTDAGRLASLGATNVVVTGNVKFDLAIDADKLALGAAWRATLAPHARRVLLLASTREHEEMALVDAFRRAYPGRPDAGPPPLLVVVPRHPSRVDDVAVRLREAGLHVQRRSTLNDPSRPNAGLSLPPEKLNVWLGDSMGEMQAYYAMCDVAVVCGSFQPLGGQNLIEAAALGKPIIMGPSTFNFADAVRLALKADAMLSAADEDAAMRAAAALLADPDRLQAMSDNAAAFATLHVGATAKSLAVIRNCMPQTRAH